MPREQHSDGTRVPSCRGPRMADGQTGIIPRSAMCADLARPERPRLCPSVIWRRSAALQMCHPVPDGGGPKWHAD